MIDGERGLGNGQVFPAGPLRAPLPPQLARTDALIVIGDGAAADAVAADIAAQGKPVLRAHLEPDEASVAALRGKRVLAFAGIGDPAAIFQDAARERHRCGARSAPLPIIIRFRKREIEGLIADAKRDALTLVTTEKDLARLRSGGSLPDSAKDIVPFAVTLEFDDAARLRKFVADRLFKAREKKIPQREAPSGLRPERRS